MLRARHTGQEERDAHGSPPGLPRAPMSSQPSPPGRREQKRHDTHLRIYATAMALFAEFGFEQVNVGQIAQGAAVSVPTFYAHYASKEQIVLPVPTSEDFAPFVALAPAGLPFGETIRQLTPRWFAQFDGADRAALLARWRVVATTPSLRVRAAEYERTTAEAMIGAFVEAGWQLSASDRVIAMAYLTAFTATFLAWADENGARPLEEIASEAFEALRGL